MVSSLHALKERSEGLATQPFYWNDVVLRVLYDASAVSGGMRRNLAKGQHAENGDEDKRTTTTLKN
jgi:hypothetical protein